MKKISTMVVVMFAFFASVNAQKVNKLGYLSSMELIGLMPESAKADSALQKFAAELESLGQQMYMEYQKKATDAETKISKGQMTEIQKELVAKELADLEKRITDFQQTANDRVDQKREELYAPIMQKANEGIKTVAKQNGYTYIFDSSAGSILYAEESDDIMPLVKAHLKLPDPKPAPTTAPKIK